MKQSDIDKLLELRAAWDKLKSCGESRAKADLDAYYNVFWKYGMERPDELAAFNEEMCLALVREYRTAYGQCDGCEGYKGTPPCVVLYGENACYHKRQMAHTHEDAYRMLLAGRRLGQTLNTGEISKNYSTSVMSAKHPISFVVNDGYMHIICPPGHGFYYRCDKSDEEIRREAFTVMWSV